MYNPVSSFDKIQKKENNPPRGIKLLRWGRDFTVTARPSGPVLKERGAGVKRVDGWGVLLAGGRGEDESADFVGRKELFSGSLRLGCDTLLCLFFVFLFFD